MNLTYKKLWKLLIDRNLKKTDLQRMTGISTVSLAKLGKNEDVSTGTLKKICNALQCDLSDIVEIEMSDDVKYASKTVHVKKDVPKNIFTLGTVFSGIGAIEHALDRMAIPHRIAFACDNGDIDILSTEIPNDINEILAEFTKLHNLIQDITPSSQEDIERKTALDLELLNNKNKFETARSCFRCSDELLSYDTIDIIGGLIIDIFTKVVAMPDVRHGRRVEYKKFLLKLQASQDDEKKLNVLKFALELINDFLKDNPQKLLIDAYEINPVISSDGIAWSQIISNLAECYKLFESIKAKRIIKAMNDVAERLSMLHERITTFHITKKIAALKTYEEKKRYIDSLYSEKLSQNKVRDSYLANYPLAAEDFHWNVSFLDGTHYSQKIDLFVGGSPCQSFSLVGKQRGLEDTRGTLFYDFARLVKEICPKVFIYENVKAVLSNDNGRTWETMQKVFTDLHYKWKYQVLNARDYGIPQNRERLFVVGFREDLELERPFDFPKPIPLTHTMQDFLLDNVSGQYYLPAKGVDFVTKDTNLSKRYTQIDGVVQLCQKKNQQFNWHGDFVFVEEAKAKTELIQDLDKYFLSEKVRKYVLASGTKGFYSRPKTDLKIARPLLTTMHKMHRAGVDNYVTTDGRLRKLTPRECLRLMGFCDSFKIVVSDTSMYQQSGNAIVVDVLIAILNEIKKSYPSIFGKEGVNG